MSEHLIRANAINDVVLERHRQISAEGYTAEHDDAHDRGELARAAAAYALAGAAKAAYPEQPEIWRAAAESWPFAEAAKHKHEPRRLFVIAAAFLIAEIERLDRQAEAAEAHAIGEYDAREATGWAARFAYQHGIWARALALSVARLPAAAGDSAAPASAIGAALDLVASHEGKTP